MKKLAFLFLMFAVLGAGVFFVACSDENKVEPPPPPPTVTLNKIIWGVEVPKDFESFTTTAEAAAAVAAKKATATINAIEPTPAIDMSETTTDKVVAFFASNPDGTEIIRLTPKGVSAVQLNKEPAPNGDFWFWTKAGIFITNLQTQKPQILISTQELASKFTDPANQGLFWFDNLLKAYNEHAVKDISWGWSSVSFIPTPENDGNYLTLLMLNSSYIMASEGLPQKSAQLALVYDSRTGQYENIFPYMKNPADYTYQLSNNENNISIIPLAFNRVSQKLLIIIMADQDKWLYVQYDPLTRKFDAFAPPTGPIDMTTSQYIETEFNYKQNCFMYTAPVEMPFDENSCKETYVPTAGVVSDDPKELEARKKVAACMQAAIKDINIAVYCMPGQDVTDYFSSTDKLSGLIKMTFSGGPKIVANINASLIEQFASSDANANKQGLFTSTTADVTCLVASNTSASCYPAMTTVYGPSTSIKSKQKIAAFWLSDPISDHRYVKGEIKDGDKVLSALYDLNISTGESKLIDKADNNSFFDYIQTLSETKDGTIYIYQKTAYNPDAQDSISSKTISFYDPALGVPNILAQTSSQTMPDYFMYPLFLGMGEGKIYSNHIISHDKAYAFLGIGSNSDDALLSYTLPKKIYKLDLAKFYTVASTSDQTKTATSVKIAASEQSPLGDGWVLAHDPSDKEDFGISLKTYGDGKIGFTANYGDKTYLYWSNIGDTKLNRISTTDMESDETLTALISKTGSFAALGDMLSFDISTDVNNQLACGGETVHANYCASSKQMCFSKKCVDMYSCSSSAPKGVCENAGEQCTDGVCTATPKKACSAHKDCPANYACANALCEVSDKACQVAEQCGASQYYKCTNGQCIYGNACTENANCPIGTKCVETACVNAPEEQCQVAAQCGTAVNFLCNEHHCVYKPVGLDVKTSTKFVGAQYKEGVLNKQNATATFAGTWTIDKGSVGQAMFLCSLLRRVGTEYEPVKSDSMLCVEGQTCSCAVTDDKVVFINNPLAANPTFWPPLLYKYQVLSTGPGSVTLGEQEIKLTKPTRPTK